MTTSISATVDDHYFVVAEPKLMETLQCRTYMGVSENRGPEYSTLNSRILNIRTPKNLVPLISETPTSPSCEITKPLHYIEN